MSSEDERPRLSIEGPYEQWPCRAPHCDSRILHTPEECDFCRDAAPLQAERERLGVSNTGKTNRKYPCPADQARSPKDYHAWGGNRPKTFEQVEEEAAAFAERLKELGLVIDND